MPSVNRAEKILTIIALPLAFLLLMLGYFSVRRERRWMCISFMGGLIAAMGYFSYKVCSPSDLFVSAKISQLIPKIDVGQLFRIWRGRNDPYSYQNVFKSLTVFSAFAQQNAAV